MKVSETFGAVGIIEDDTYLVCKPCGVQGATPYQQVIIPSKECAVCHKFCVVVYRYLKPKGEPEVNTDNFTCNRCCEPFEVCQCGHEPSY